MWKTVEHDYQAAKKGNCASSGTTSTCDKRRNRKKWNGVPITDLGLSVNSNINGRSVAAPLPQVNAWHLKKGSDLFAKKNNPLDDFKMVETSGTELEEDDDDDDLRRALQESLKTAEVDRKRLTVPQLEPKSDTDYSSDTAINRKYTCTGIIDDDSTSDELLPANGRSYKKNYAASDVVVPANGESFTNRNGERNKLPKKTDIYNATNAVRSSSFNKERRHNRENSHAVNKSRANSYYTNKINSSKMAVFKTAQNTSPCDKVYHESEESWDPKSDDEIDDRNVGHKLAMKRQDNRHSYLEKKRHCVERSVHSKDSGYGAERDSVSSSPPRAIIADSVNCRETCQYKQNSSLSVEDDRDSVFCKSPLLAESPEIVITNMPRLSNSPMSPGEGDSVRFVSNSSNFFEKNDIHVMQTPEITTRKRANHVDVNSNLNDKVDSDLIDSMLKLENPKEEKPGTPNVNHAEQAACHNYSQALHSKCKEIQDLINMWQSTDAGLNALQMQQLLYPLLKATPPVGIPNFMNEQFNIPFLPIMPQVLPSGQLMPEILNQQLLYQAMNQQQMSLYHAQMLAMHRLQQQQNQLQQQNLQQPQRDQQVLQQTLQQQEQQLQQHCLQKPHQQQELLGNHQPSVGSSPSPKPQKQLTSPTFLSSPTTELQYAKVKSPQPGFLQVGLLPSHSTTRLHQATNFQSQPQPAYQPPGHQSVQGLPTAFYQQPVNAQHQLPAFQQQQQPPNGIEPCLQGRQFPANTQSGAVQRGFDQQQCEEHIRKLTDLMSKQTLENPASLVPTPHVASSISQSLSSAQFPHQQYHVPENNQNMLSSDEQVKRLFLHQEEILKEQMYQQMGQNHRPFIPGVGFSEPNTANQNHHQLLNQLQMNQNHLMSATAPSQAHLIHNTASTNPMSQNPFMSSASPSQTQMHNNAGTNPFFHLPSPNIPPAPISGRGRGRLTN